MRISAGVLLTLALLAVSPGGGAGAAAVDAVKPGRWEFTSQLQLPGAPPTTAAAPAGASASHTMCVDPDKAVPADPRPECKTERMSREGGTVNWATACTSPRGAVRSDGVAHYRGDAMEASLTTHIPQPDGHTIDTHQRIIGRYLGPCRK